VICSLAGVQQLNDILPIEAADIPHISAESRQVMFVFSCFFYIDRMEQFWNIRALSVTCYRSRCPVSSSDEAALSILLLLKLLLHHISSVYVVVYLPHIHLGYINRQYSFESYLLLLCNFRSIFLLRGF